MTEGFGQRHLARMIPVGLPPLPEPAGIFAVLTLALAIDVIWGDPDRLYARIPHPVVWIGRLITAFEALWNKPQASGHIRYVCGVATTILTISASVGVAWLLAWALRQWSFGWCLEALAASTLIAYGSLRRHVSEVATALAQDLPAGRAAVGRIVGRAPETLDETGVARAAVESAAENFSDGVIAPLFWLALLGLPGIAAYKAINTLDSMIGYRNARYMQFGAFAARLDDAANWLPARISAGVICLAARLVNGANGRRAMKILIRDGNKHASPNAGRPEAAMAGALGIALGGPRRYGDRLRDAPWIGEDTGEPASTADIYRALSILRAGTALVGAGALLCALAGIG